MPDSTDPQKNQEQAPAQQGSSATEQSVQLDKINREFKEKAVAQKAAELGLPYVNIATTPINPDLLRIIPPETAKKGMIMPFYRIGKKIRVAIADPNNEFAKKAIEDLRAREFEININLTSEEGINKALKLFETDQYKVKKEIDTSLEEGKIKAFEQEIAQLKDLEAKLKTVPSEEGLYLINVGAIKTGASDIHYEPEEKDIKIRFRIDGLLHHILTIDKGTYTNIANQIKYFAKMKLNISNEPQDGRFSFNVNERKVDVRVSSLPTQYGETFVCRLLDSKRKAADFKEMGFEGPALNHIKQVLNLKHGMVLVTGPTGSGKSTTLYTLLEHFIKPELKIITLEDPIEYHLSGVSQSQINEKRGYDFANGLRAILRQDPDIVMLGEIRDLETAEVAAQAALTGHVLLSTLHTNSAIESIPRLINIGVPPFMVAPALDTVIGQRLVRRFCTKCAQEEVMSKSKREELERVLAIVNKIQPSLKLEIPEKLPRAVGCEECSHTGYKGRISIIEMLDIDNEIKGLILEKASSTKLIEAARRKGMLTMYEDGIIKVIRGITSITEVRRVTAMVT